MSGVTSAILIEKPSHLPKDKICSERLLKVADGSELLRRSFQEMRLPLQSEWVILSSGEASGAILWINGAGESRRKWKMSRY